MRLSPLSVALVALLLLAAPFVRVARAQTFPAVELLDTRFFTSCDADTDPGVANLTQCVDGEGYVLIRYVINPEVAGGTQVGSPDGLSFDTSDPAFLATTLGGVTFSSVSTFTLAYDEASFAYAMSIDLDVAPQEIVPSGYRIARDANDECGLSVRYCESLGCALLAQRCFADECTGEYTEFPKGNCTNPSLFAVEPGDFVDQTQLVNPPTGCAYLVCAECTTPGSEGEVPLSCDTAPFERTSGAGRESWRWTGDGWVVYQLAENPSFGYAQTVNVNSGAGGGTDIWGLNAQDDALMDEAPSLRVYQNGMVTVERASDVGFEFKGDLPSMQSGYVLARNNLTEGATNPRSPGDAPPVDWVFGENGVDRFLVNASQCGGLGITLTNFTLPDREPVSAQGSVYGRSVTVCGNYAGTCVPGIDCWSASFRGTEDPINPDTIINQGPTILPPQMVARNQQDFAANASATPTYMPPHYYPDASNPSAWIEYGVMHYQNTDSAALGDTMELRVVFSIVPFTLMAAGGTLDIPLPTEPMGCQENRIMPQLAIDLRINIVSFAPFDSVFRVTLDCRQYATVVGGATSVEVGVPANGESDTTFVIEPTGIVDQQSEAGCHVALDNNVEEEIYATFATCLLASTPIDTPTPTPSPTPSPTLPPIVVPSPPPSPTNMTGGGGDEDGSVPEWLLYGSLAFGGLLMVGIAVCIGVAASERAKNAKEGKSGGSGGDWVKYGARIGESAALAQQPLLKVAPPRVAAASRKRVQ